MPLVVNWLAGVIFEISRASDGDLDETLDVALTKVIGEDAYGSFKTGIGFAYEVRHAEAERKLRAELGKALVQATKDMVTFAGEHIKQEQ